MIKVWAWLDRTRIAATVTPDKVLEAAENIGWSVYGIPFGVRFEDIRVREWGREPGATIYSIYKWEGTETVHLGTVRAEQID